MTRRPARALALAAALPLALAGCLDLVEVPRPGPPGGSPPATFVTVTLVHALPGSAGPDTLLVDGQATVGTDSLGTPRAFADPVLRVMGLPVPDTVYASGVRGWREARPLAPGAAASEPVTVELPRMPSPAPPPPVVRVLAAARTGPGVLTLPRGSDLTLPLRPSTDAPGGDATRDERWSLVLERDPGGSVVLSGDGRVPLPLVVPAAWLPVGGDRLHARLQVDRSLRRRDPATGTSAEVRVLTLLRWEVHLTGSSPDLPAARRR